MVNIKTPEEIKIMVAGGKILSRIMKELAKKVKPGVAAKELEDLAEALISNYGGKSSFKGYEGYPNCLCVSINEQLVHGLPDNRVFKAGDLVSLDLGILYPSPSTSSGSASFHTDMAITVGVGRISPLAKKLLKVTRQALEIGKKQAKPGNRVADISQAIQAYVEKNGFNVVRELCGHGIGRELHEDPQILNFAVPRGSEAALRGGGDEEIVLESGMTICLEPMVTAGDWRLRKSADGFGYETKDKSLSCHFEQTILVTKGSCQVLTNY